MLHIEQLRIHLPQDFEHRAGGISQRVGVLLKNMPNEHWQSAQSLQIPGVKISPQATDADIANAVARSIQARLGENR